MNIPNITGGSSSQAFQESLASAPNCHNYFDPPDLNKQIWITRSVPTQRYEIIEIANKLFIHTDERDWEKVKAIFADEVLFDMTSMAGGQPAKLKPQEIVDAWDKGLKNLKAIHHQVGNYLVTKREKDADLFCYGIAFHFLPNPTNVNSRVFVGSYNLHFVDTEKGWKIDHFKFNLKFIDGNKDLELHAE